MKCDEGRCVSLERPIVPEKGGHRRNKAEDARKKGPIHSLFGKGRQGVSATILPLLLETGADTFHVFLASDQLPILKTDYTSFLFRALPLGDRPTSSGFTRIALDFN
jgi:hypothetical protein